MIELLHKAAQLAGECQAEKSFYMACLVVRRDGATVASVNHDISGQAIPSGHAEARALRKADHGSVLYVARVLKRDRKTWAMAYPCAFCRALIRNRGVKKAYYTIGPNRWGTWIPSQR
jgi:pyrimidine deaminase RibD-like protein